MAVNLSDFERLFLYAEPIAAVVLLMRLWHEELLSRYRFVALSLLCNVAEVGIRPISRLSSVYFYVFTADEAIVSLVLIGLVIELFSLVVRDYPGIARSGRSFISLAFGVAILGSLLFTLFYPQTGPGHAVTLEHYFLVFRVVAFALMAFLMLLMAFVLWFPIPVSRNVLWLASGYSCYLTCRALTRFGANLFGPDKYILLSTIAMGVLVVCLGFWTIFLTRRGDNVDVVVGQGRKHGGTEIFVRQLEAINATLLGTEPPKPRL